MHILELVLTMNLEYECHARSEEPADVYSVTISDETAAALEKGFFTLSETISIAHESCPKTHTARPTQHHHHGLILIATNMMSFKATGITKIISKT